jgi:hypothetical protein
MAIRRFFSKIILLAWEQVFFRKLLNLYSPCIALGLPRVTDITDRRLFAVKHPKRIVLQKPPVLKAL